MAAKSGKNKPSSGPVVPLNYRHAGGQWSQRLATSRGDLEHLRPVTSMQRIEVLEETAYLVNRPLIRRPDLFSRLAAIARQRQFH
jgi:hypothetical protein